MTAAKGKRRRWGWWTAGVLILLSAAVPLVYEIQPRVQRWRMFNALDSDDSARQQSALQYLVQHAPNDHRTMRSLTARLHEDDDAHFEQLAAALDGAGLWRRSMVGDGPYQRRIDIMGRSPSLQARLKAVQALADLPDLADDPRVQQLLKKLIGDGDDDVRYNSLIAAAQLAGASTQMPRYRAMLQQLTMDGQSVIADQAHILLNLLDGKMSAATPDNPPPKLDRDQLAFLLSGSDAPTRDVACVLAVRQLDGSTLSQLTHDLIVDLDDDAKMSGAVLAGLTGQHLDLLAQREAVEDVFAVRTVQRLGLWMAGKMQLDPQALLLRGDVPRTTILLAMLAKGEYAALDELLNPRGAMPDNLPGLLIDQQWWRAVEPYLPPDAPSLDLKAAPAQARQQIEVLRDWRLLTRYKNGHTKTSTNAPHEETLP